MLDRRPYARISRRSIEICNAPWALDGRIEPVRIGRRHGHLGPHADAGQPEAAARRIADVGRQRKMGSRNGPAYPPVGRLDNAHLIDRCVEIVEVGRVGDDLLDAVVGDDTEGRPQRYLSDGT